MNLTSKLWNLAKITSYSKLAFRSEGHFHSKNCHIQSKMDTINFLIKRTLLGLGPSDNLIEP